MENGRVKKFEMNDRCAAGTGKFLEIMAALHWDLTIDDFGRQALAAEKDHQHFQHVYGVRRIGSHILDRKR